MGLTPVSTSNSKKKVQSQSFTSSSTEPLPNMINNDKNIQCLNSTKTLSTKIQLQYSRNGHASLRSIIPTSVLQNIKMELINYSQSQELNAWKQKVEVITKSFKIANDCTSVAQCKSILANHDSSIQIPFLQHFNTWQSPSCAAVTSLVLSPFLSNLASQLLDVPSVKLYQDSLFHKRFNDSPTPWHSDARMAPFDTSHMITFWIPLDDVPSVEEGGTGLYFVDKSHGDFALPFWNPVPKCDDHSDSNDSSTNDVYSRLEERYGGEDSIKHYMPLKLGDCTVHAGWTLHCADGGGGMMGDRYALAVTYVDAKAEIREDFKSLGHDEDRQSFRKWIGDVEPRQYFENSLVPIVWPQFT